MFRIRLLIAFLFVLGESGNLLAASMVITFESLSDGTAVTTQFSGLTFSNAKVVTAGISLNEFEFPPYSGSNVVFDHGGALSVTFAIPVSDFGAYFTYSVPLTMVAYDAAGSPVASVKTKSLTNRRLSASLGSPPNELLEVHGTGIKKVTILGDPSGGSFSLDDMTYTSSVAVPTRKACPRPTLDVSLSPAVLFPPTSRMVPITATIEVTGQCDYRVELVSITSNEPERDQFDGDMPNDVEGATYGSDDRSFSLRAERSPNGIGRIYSVTYRVRDSSGQSVSTTAVVRVPADKYRDVFEALFLFYVPLSGSPDRGATIAVQNLGAQVGSMDLTLCSATGEQIGRVSRRIEPNASIREPLTTFFKLEPAVIPPKGYIVGHSDVRVRTSISSTGSASDEVPGLAATGDSPLLFPVFALGGGYDTVLTLLNASKSDPVLVTLTVYQTGGAVLAGASPFIREIAPLERTDFDLGSLFRLENGDLTMGYFKVDVKLTSPRPFAGPQLVGMVRLAAHGTSAVGPIYTVGSNDFYFASTAETTSEYTGISLLNSGTTSTSVTVEVFTNSGLSRGSSTFSLPAGSARIFLLRELVPTSLPYEGYVHVSSSGMVVGAAVRGRQMMDGLRYLRPQIVP